MKHINILILSVGVRNYLIRAFKRKLSGAGRVIAADKSIAAPAPYDADAHYIIPDMNAPDYFDRIFDICEKENIKAVLSLIDPELSLLASKRKLFYGRGITVAVPDTVVCETAYDKMAMNLWLGENGYDTLRIYKGTDEILRDNKIISYKHPYIVKPVRGSASVNCRYVDDLRFADFLLSKNDDMLIQEYVSGEEYGVDIYVDMITGKTVSVFLKRKLQMRAGETYKAVSVNDSELSSFAAGFAEAFGLRGPADIDIIKHNGKYYILDVNPRFGGGYQFADACGCDHVGMLINNLKGMENIPYCREYEEDVILMKYSEVKKVKGEKA